jgi:hypothetical protein
MVRRSSVALMDGSFFCLEVCLEVADNVSHSRWTAYEYMDMGHFIPRDWRACQLHWLFRAEAVHVVFHERAVVDGNVSLFDVSSQTGCNLFQVLSDEEW